MAELAMYPYRPGSNQAHELEPLLHAPEYPLTPEQRGEALTFERMLYDMQIPQEFEHTLGFLRSHQEKTGEALTGIEAAWKIKINTATLGLKYFLTAEGSEEFQKVFGFYIVAEETTGVAGALLSVNLKGTDSKALSDLAGNSIEFEEKQIVNAFALNDFEDVSGLPAFEAIALIKNPETLVRKAAHLRALKGYYKAIQADLMASDPNDPVIKGKQLLLRFHRERVNQMLAELYPHACELLYQFFLKPSSEVALGLRALEESLPGFRLRNFAKREGLDVTDEKIARKLQLADRYRNGVAVVRNDSGRLAAIGPFSSEAEQLATTTIESDEEAIDRGRYANTDPQIFKDTTVDVETRVRWAQKLLGAVGILSAYDDYDIDREGPAPDGLWQAVARKQFKQHDIDTKQRVSRLPYDLDDASLAYVLPVMEHENFGHIVQALRRAMLGLALAERVGIDVPYHHQEAGPKARENWVREKLTGQKTTDIAGTSYLFAAQKRLEGAGYEECVQAYYDDYTRRYPDAPPRHRAKLAVNRTRRLFRNGGHFVEDGSGYLTNSQPLAYLEGELITRQLPESLNFLLLVGGINLGKLALLHAHGLVDINVFKQDQQTILDILEPDIRQKVNETIHANDGTVI